MSDPHDAKSGADREAAEWHVRLGRRPVSAVTLLEFKAWRATPQNAEAYQRLEALWRTSATLANDPDIQGLTRETLQASRSKAKPSRRKAIAAGVTVAAAALLLVAGFAVWRPFDETYTTAVGEQRLVRLRDGSQVRLDTATRLTVHFERAERRIALDQGQALFTVAHDSRRPFRVMAGSTEVTALGTVFGVRREAAGARVTLVSGSVSVDAAGGGPDRLWRLSPGQQLETARGDSQPRTVDAALATSWSQGRLVFKNLPLRDAVTEVNRYLPDKIVLSAGAADRVAVNGVFAAGDGDAFVAAACDLFDLTARPEPGGGVRLTASSVGG